MKIRLSKRILREDDLGDEIDIPGINLTNNPQQPNQQQATPKSNIKSTQPPPKQAVQTPKSPAEKQVAPKKVYPIITRDEAVRFIKTETRGKIFTVTFIERKDGSNRIMTCRLGVKKYLKGGTLPYDPVEKNLIPVFDIKIKQYRMINIDGLTSLTWGRQIYLIK